MKSMTSLGYLANEAKRSGRIIGEDGDFVIVAIPKSAIARRRQQQRDSLRARRTKARLDYMVSKGEISADKASAELRKLRPERHEV